MAPAPLIATAVRLRITLKGSKPAIWREVLVPASMTLQTLHQTIQAAMGWWEAHLFEFDTGDDRIGEPDPDWDDARVTPARGVRLASLLRRGVRRLGMVSIDGNKLDANASKIRSVRYDRAKELRVRLAADIAALTARGEAADAEAQPDPQALPAEIARREALKAKLDAACARLKAQARVEAEARPEYEAKKAASEAKKGRRRGRPSKLPEDDPPPERQSNLTDPDSALTRRSDAHQYRQAYNAQAVVGAKGSQLILATSVVATAADAPSFASTILGMEHGIGLPSTVLADTGFASGPAVAALAASGIEPLVAIGCTQPHRPYDFPPPPNPKTPRRITEPWRLAMQAWLETKMPKTATPAASRPSNPSSASSKPPSASPASTSAASPRPPASGP